MSANDNQQSTAISQRKPSSKTLLGALAGALFGAILGIVLSKSLGLGERVQQMNLTNTGSKPILVRIETARMKGDGDLTIEPGKEGRFIYGEGDKLTIFPGPEPSDNGHSVALERKPILAEANADESDKIRFAYK
jgi:hypothetical protein